MKTSMTISADDVVTRQLVQDRVEEVLAEAKIYNPRVDEYQTRNGDRVFRIDAAEYVVEVEFDQTAQDPLEDFIERLGKKLRNLIMSAAPTTVVGDHSVTITKHEGDLVAQCDHCGVKISADEYVVKHATPDEIKKMKKWFIGFFSRGYNVSDM